MKKIIFISLLAPLFCCCTRTVYLPQVSSHREIDTLVMEVADSSLFRALFECDSNNRVVISRMAGMAGEMAKQNVSFDDGELDVRTRWRTKYVERIRELRDTVTVVRTRVVESPPGKIPRIYKVSLWIALLAAGWGAWRLMRLLRVIR